MQITNKTRKILGGDHKDLKDHLVTITKDELNDPNINICSGVRWLFEKRRLASHDLKRSATWIETVWVYKDAAGAGTKADEDKIKKIFNLFYEELKQCKFK